MDEATDFLVMAATLLEIKSRSMLPKPPPPEDPNALDPEAELIRRLEEYKRFRETVTEMQQFEDAARQLFTKLPEEYPLPPQETELVGLTLQGLTDAFLRILERTKEKDAPVEVNHYHARSIHRDEHTVQGCMLDLLNGLRQKGRLRFEEAFSEDPTREEVVTLFLAMLELLKLGRMHFEQDGTYGEILLLPSARETIDEYEEDAK